jgi:hypothetical protein
MGSNPIMTCYIQDWRNVGRLVSPTRVDAGHSRLATFDQSSVQVQILGLGPKFYFRRQTTCELELILTVLLIICLKLG